MLASERQLVRLRAPGRSVLVIAHLSSISEPMWLGHTTEEAWGFVTDLGIVRGLASSLDDASREEAMAELHRRISASETADGVLL